jgi:iron complex transport system ATP-binding protein
MTVATDRAPVLELTDVFLWLPEGLQVLQQIDWTVRPGDQWALLGPNGSGKSTLISIAGAMRFPSKGAAEVLGKRLGTISLWDLREQIGHISPSQTVHDWQTVEDVVLTGATSTAWVLHDRVNEADRMRAREQLELVGALDLAEREFATLSQGEKQRVRIARALMPDPPLLLLDEPATGLDLPSREALLSALAVLARRKPDQATVFVSHHLEELPPSTTHAMLLRAGEIVASGPAPEVLTSENVSAAFGYPITVTYHDGRWSARGSASWHTRREDLDGHENGSTDANDTIVT